MYRHIEAGLVGKVATIRLNRPGKRNALNLDLGGEIKDAVHKLTYRSDAAVLVVEGAGSSFCAGFDMESVWTEGSARDRLLEFDEFASMFQAIEQAPVVKIAKINGPAVGAGTVLAAVCDLRYGSHEARIGIPEVELGLPFSMGGFPRIARLIGLSKAADLVLTGRFADAEEAHAAGFYSRLFHADDLDEKVAEIAETLASRPAYFLLEEVSRLQEISEGMLHAGRSDLTTMLGAHMDLESVQHGAGYVSRFAHK